MNQIVPATHDHAVELATRLRKADLNELKASSGITSADALVLSVALSGSRAKAWLSDGRVIALFGVGDTGVPGVGSPWLMASPEAELQKTFLLRQSKSHVHEMLDEFPLLTNYVDCRNIVSIQWLHWCGFALCEVEPFHGVQRLPFIRFQLARR